jgi:ABC-type dipeptide/oligopeptide/nickel transport system ATPase component
LLGVVGESGCGKSVTMMSMLETLPGLIPEVTTGLKAFPARRQT